MNLVMNKLSIFRISKDENLEENQNNLIRLAQEFVNKITSSANRYDSYS